MIQPQYHVVQRYDKKNHLSRYHVVQPAGVSIADFASLVQAACVARYLSMDTVTYNERKIALDALKAAEGYGLDLENIDMTLPDTEERKNNDG